jgi:hypothetical protein
LKHGWLYLHQLDTFAALEQLIAFYVDQHNTMFPRAAFAGHARARAARVESNRRLSCGACRPPGQDAPRLPDSPAKWRLLHLHDEMSGMS